MLICCLCADEEPVEVFLRQALDVVAVERDHEYSVALVVLVVLFFHSYFALLVVEELCLSVLFFFICHGLYRLLCYKFVV